MKTLCLKVWGDYACFTRPEMKVERVSYDVIPPSAARAIFEAILWKPAIRWQVTKIEVLKPIRWISVRRNEVGAVASLRSVQTAMQAGRGNLGLYIEEERQQRAGLFLRDVAYRLHARFEMTAEKGAEDSPEKFLAMFNRRAETGQCFNQPYLGCREFAAHFELIRDSEAAGQAEPPTDETRDLGWMLHDIDFANGMQPRFFRAQMRHGVIEVPEWDSEGVKG
ncbi:MAG TPA: type I-C CRISPR-associated protein Cas5c [Methylococcus sp.]|nr:type I-C CRISPR-associated protein Cas5c [Methylococcus sp.]